MSLFNYSRFKIAIDPESKKTQGLKVGDIVRREYSESSHLIYSLMIVLETGVDVIGGKDSHYFIGALVDGDEPKSGELLDFVRVANLHDPDRSGALYFTASDSEAPYMDVIDNIAQDYSLCYPCMIGSNPKMSGKYAYTLTEEKNIISDYVANEQGVSRILKLYRYQTSSDNNKIELKQVIDVPLKHPQRVIISYMVRGSVATSGNPVIFGYENGKEIDGSTTVSFTKEWTYYVHLVTIDYPPTNKRSLVIDLTGALASAGTRVEIANLNIILLEDIVSFSKASKGRVGKIKGIVDPVFGTLEGYGAYFQNLYATKNVNIAGTLTAADQNGFSSTFYVGKIHKNVVENSLHCRWHEDTPCEILPDEITPVGIGNAYVSYGIAGMILQSDEWVKEHVGERYCFSCWLKSEKEQNLLILTDMNDPTEITLPGNNEWVRYSHTFTIFEGETGLGSLAILLSEKVFCICAPQLEAGEYPTLYQPTDGTLSYVEDYGAWFSKGGIGGTIQNPLLRLEEDGSICSRDKSFVIYPDGTGQFASGRFKWSKDTITLQDVTIKWEDLDEETKDELSPITVDLVSKNGYVVKNESNDVDITAILYRNGKEIDADGNLFSYSWHLWNTTGTKIINNYSGKSVTVSRKDMEERCVLKYDISEK